MTDQPDAAELEEALKRLQRSEKLKTSRTHMSESVGTRQLNSPRRILEEWSRIAQDPSEPGKTRAAALEKVFRYSGFPIPKEVESYEILSDEEIQALFQKTFEDAIRATKCAYWVVVDKEGNEKKIRPEVRVT